MTDGGTPRRACEAKHPLKHLSSDAGVNRALQAASEKHGNQED